MNEDFDAKKESVSEFFSSWGKLRDLINEGKFCIDKRIKIGRLKVQFEWRSKKCFMGRFGGGWNWHLGIMWSGRTFVIFFLMCMLRFDLNKKEKKND